MSKISMRQVYSRVLERNREEIEERKRDGHEAMRYDYQQFALDMMARDFISTPLTIGRKWDAMVADRVIEIPSGCRPRTRSVLWLDSLIAAADGRRLVRASLPSVDETRVCMCVSAMHCHAGEGSE